MTIALTGASGLLGMALCHELLQKKITTRVLVHRNRHPLEGLPVVPISGSLDDKTALENLCAGADVLFHLAGRISIGQVSETELEQTNVTGTAGVIAACQRTGVRRLIHFSSVHAYRSVSHDGVFDESAPPAFAYPYERTKASAQALVLQANGRDGLETLCLNPTAVLGPWDYTPSLQGRMVRDLLWGRIPVLSPGGFDWVDSRDVARAAFAAIALGRPGEAYLISGRYATMLELAHLLGQISGQPMPTRALPFWLLNGLAPLFEKWGRLRGQQPLFTRESLAHVATGHPRVSHAKAARDLDYRPRPLEQTLQDVYHWFWEKNLA